MNPKNENERYVNRAADILADLVRENRRHLPSPEKQAQQLKNELNSLEQVEKKFTENSKMLIEWIYKNRLKK